MKERGRIVYLAPVDESEGTGAPPYGDLWLLDLQTYEETRLTDNRFWDGPPHFSPDGQRVAFATKREGSRNYLETRGLGAKEQIYILDVRTRKLSKIGKSWDRKKVPSFWESIAWAHDGESLLCGAIGLPPSTVVNISVLTDSMKIVAVVNSRGQMWQRSPSSTADRLTAPTVWELRPSSNGEYWAVNFGFLDRGIFLYSPHDSTARQIVEPQPRVSLGNWTNDGKALVYVVNGRIFKHNLVHNATDSIPFEILESPWKPHQALVTQNDKYVVCVEKEVEGVNPEYRLLMYDPTVRALEWLTPSGVTVSEWDYVDVTATSVE